MKKRTALLLLAVLLLLASLTGCAADQDAGVEAPNYDGAWYFAKNGVECRFQDGKIYRDDLHAKEGQTLMGIYSLVGDHIQANLTGVGGVHEPRDLYIVQTDGGQVLCDTAAGDGTLYFYQDPLTALAAMETAQPTPAAQEPSSAPSPDSGQVLSLEPSVDLANGDEPSDRSVAAPAPDEPSPPPESADNPGSGYVWIPKSGSKYHSTPNCSGMKDPTKVTKTDAVNKGYTPCKRCH